MGNFKLLFQNQKVMYLKSEGIRAKYIILYYIRVRCNMKMIIEIYSLTPTKQEIRIWR